MEQEPLKPMTPFDGINTPEELYMMKLILPYTPVGIQRFLAVFVKFLELRHTMSFFRKCPCRPSGNILHDLIPYLNKESREMMEQMEAMMSMMEMVQSMGADTDNPQEMFSMFGDMFGADMDIFQTNMNETKET